MSSVSKCDVTNNSDFIMLKKLIKSKLGFNCEQYKASHFKRRIDVRMRATGCVNYSDYIKVLNKDQLEYRHLKDALTVNVTEFFRNPDTYNVVEKELLPAIISLKSRTPLKSIRIWSAGCSIGVEAYSIAILLHRLLGKDFKKYKISIIGTDIDENSLSKAREGIYSKLDIKNVDDETIEKYFEASDGKYHVIDELKNITSFKKNDLISGTKLKGFDIIFCRNVTIYFEKELQEKLYYNFYEALNEGGFYVMGKTETLIGPAKDLFKPFSLKERIYHKENSHRAGI